MSIHSIVMTSALTVINYDEVLLNDTTVPTAASTRYNWTNGAGRTMENVITSEVWLYNLASRSRVLALVVAAVGCVSVGLSFVLSVAPWPYTSKPEVLTLFREALGQHPQDDLIKLSSERVGTLPYRAESRCKMTVRKKALGRREVSLTSCSSSVTQ
jgi:hypothetical protein